MGYCDNFCSMTVKSNVVATHCDLTLESMLAAAVVDVNQFDVRVRGASVDEGPFCDESSCTVNEVYIKPVISQPRPIESLGFRHKNCQFLNLNFVIS